MDACSLWYDLKCTDLNSDALAIKLAITLYKSHI